MKHPVVPIVAGDVYTHDFIFVTAGTAWSVHLLDPHMVDVAGVAITVTIVNNIESRIRVNMAATETAKLKGIKYSPCIRLRDDTVGQTRMEWLLEVR